jgi:Dockerin type I domain
VGSPFQPINVGTLTITIPGTLRLAGDIVNGNLVVGDGTNSTTIQLPTNNGGTSLSSLTISANSTLDIANNHVIINYADGTQATVDAAIRGYLINGYNGGTWTGSSGLGAGGSLDSSTAAMPANSQYGLGYADGADDIVTGLSSGQLEIKYTIYGDANLDGVVSGADFSIVVGNLGKSVSGWDKGDFNYDGVVSGVDFSLLAGNLGKAANGADITLPASDIAAIDAFAAANGLMADVPEPGNMGLALMAGIGFLYSRRRSQVGGS